MHRHPPKKYQVNIPPWFHEHLSKLADSKPGVPNRKLAAFIHATLWDFVNDPWLVLGDQPGAWRKQRHKVVMQLPPVLESLLGGYAALHRLTIPTLIRTVLVDAHDPTPSPNSVATRRAWFEAVRKLGFIYPELPISSQPTVSKPNIEETPNP